MWLVPLHTVRMGWTGTYPSGEVPTYIFNKQQLLAILGVYIIHMIYYYYTVDVITLTHISCSNGIYVVSENL